MAFGINAVTRLLSFKVNRALNKLATKFVATEYGNKWAQGLSHPGYKRMKMFHHVEENIFNHII